jgi:hypothetical protein
MDAQDEEICHIMLRLLYPRAELMESPEPISVHDLSVAIDSDEDSVKANLIDLQRRGLVAIKDGGVTHRKDSMGDPPEREKLLPLPLSDTTSNG